MSNPPAIFNMLCSVTFRRPRPTWPRYVQCRPHSSAAFSWLNPNTVRSSRTRRPNSRVAGDTGDLDGAGTPPSPGPMTINPETTNPVPLNPPKSSYGESTETDGRVRYRGPHATTQFLTTIQ